MGEECGDADELMPIFGLTSSFFASNLGVILFSLRFSASAALCVVIFLFLGERREKEHERRGEGF